MMYLFLLIVFEYGLDLSRIIYIYKINKYDDFFILCQFYIKFHLYFIDALYSKLFC